MTGKDCEYCRILEDSNTPKIYEDEHVVAFASAKPVAEGQITIISKRHHPIIELVPDYVVADIFSVANKVSMALFDELKVEGTNILVQNGVPAGQQVAHFSAHVVPRRQNDGLNYQWEPKKLTEEEMSTIEIKYKEETTTIGTFEDEKKEEVVHLDTSEEADEAEEDGTEDLRIQKVNRVPKW
ncbi:MAG: HIT domain-containing protein [archaeon]